MINCDRLIKIIKFRGARAPRGSEHLSMQFSRSQASMLENGNNRGDEEKLRASDVTVGFRASRAREGPMRRYLGREADALAQEVDEGRGKLR